MKNRVLLAFTLIILAILNYAVFLKERTIRDGETILLQLAPVDPRSLMQGDYMRLSYKIERQTSAPLPPGCRFIVIRVDENKIASFVRYHQNEPLQSGEKLLRIRPFYNNFRISPDSFLFQEGHSDQFSKAQYGVFKSDSSYNHVLIGLADADHNLIGGDS